MRATVAALVLAVVVVVAARFAFREPAWDAERVYREYDRELRTYAAEANRCAAKEVLKIEPLSQQFRVPEKLTIRGTPYEIGRMIGHIGLRTNAPLPLVKAADRGMNEKVSSLYRRIYPEQLELLRGVAAVYSTLPENIDLRVFESNFTTPMWCKLLRLKNFEDVTDFQKFGQLAMNHHCSAASYFAGGHQFVGVNFDHASDRATFFTTIEMDGCYKAMGHTVYELTGELVDGMNEKGLALCVASNNYGKYETREAYPDEPAVVMWHMMEIVLQKCATVDEALKLLRSARVWFPDECNHWLLADATGKSVIVEWTPNDRKLIVFDSRERYELMTNTACQEGEEYLMKNCARYAAAKPLLDKGVHSAIEMLKVMESMRISHGPGRSLWTSVMDLKTGTMNVRYYKEYVQDYEFRL